jgi:hypothetical protein
MKTKLLLAICLCFSIYASLTSCSKEKSVLKGRVTYIGAITGTEYSAGNTTVYLYLNNTSGSPYETTTTDSDGYYEFYNLFEGIWYIYSETTVNGIDYWGTTVTSSVDGKNTVQLNLVME